jgi:hypothetical protein
VTRLLRRLVAYLPWHIRLGALLVGPLFGQTVQPIPSCGKPGDTICISGSGWAEPNPLCRYIFTMDSVSIAPDQQDGVYGPPATNGTVPALANGNHTILIQLVLDDASSTLVQQATAPFSIVTNQPNPWAASNTSSADINYNFNPQNVCSVSPCTKLVFIQVLKEFAIQNDGTQVVTNQSFWGFPAAQDADFTANMFTVDRYYGAAVPYYHDGVGAGNNAAVGPPLPATSNDAPNRSSFPAGYKGILIQFETAIFCAAGDDMGKYYGRILWQFTQSAGQVAGTSTILSTDQNQPSADFLAAVTKWNSNPAHPYTLPTPNPATCIYN